MSLVSLVIVCVIMVSGVFCLQFSIIRCLSISWCSICSVVGRVRLWVCSLVR